MSLIKIVYTLSHPKNDCDVTERAQRYTLQDASFMRQSQYSFFNVRENTSFVAITNAAPAYALTSQSFSRWDTVIGGEYINDRLVEIFLYKSDFPFNYNKMERKHSRIKMKIKKKPWWKIPLFPHITWHSVPLKLIVISTSLSLSVLPICFTPEPMS